MAADSETCRLKLTRETGTPKSSVQPDTSRILIRKILNDTAKENCRLIRLTPNSSCRQIWLSVWEDTQKTSTEYIRNTKADTKLSTKVSAERSITNRKKSIRYQQRFLRSDLFLAKRKVQSTIEKQRSLRLELDKSQSSSLRY